MGRIVFLGDSFASGEGNQNISFVDYIKRKYPNLTIHNLGVSGTTIGEYSIYPVDGYSLLHRYKKTDVEHADRIFLEYGINDISALMCGFTDIKKITVSLVKALDGIYQTNYANPEIFFLSISNDDDIIDLYAERQCRYLEREYFSRYDFKFPPTIWAENYKHFIDNVSKMIPVVPMITQQNFLFQYMSSDNIHPNDMGHQVIAENILKIRA